MAWELEIIHVDLENEGDSTLIVVKENSVVKRTALIDGGAYGAVKEVKRCLKKAIPDKTNLDVIVVTHYDGDHMGGVRKLLEENSSLVYDSVIYDQGEPGDWSNFKFSDASPEFSGNDDDYTRYRNAVQSGNKKGLSGKRKADSDEAVGRYKRATDQVMATAPPKQKLPKGWNTAEWLLGQEILWKGGALPVGAPTLTCVAANEYLYQGKGKNGPLDPLYRPSSQTKDAKNPRSLAFLLNFNNFSYFIGGDLESPQEDALAVLTNTDFNPAGRVHCLKTSHHGSAYSSSANFIKALKPMAAFISCGTDNQYGHPHQPVVDNLEKEKVGYYLTGENYKFPPDDKKNFVTLGPNAYIAGIWPPVPYRKSHIKEGDISILVAEDESKAPKVRFRVVFNQPKAGWNVKRDEKFDYSNPVVVTHSYTQA